MNYRTCRKIVAFALLAGWGEVYAQQPAKKPAQPSMKRDRTAEIRPWVGITGEFDNNIFLLSNSRRADLEAADGADPGSRFKDMDAASDFIVETAAGLRLKSDGLGGRDFVIDPEIRYEHYVKNSERSNLTASVDLTQDFPRASRLRARLAYTPDYFSKNYLSDAVDTNADGRIAASERRYSAGRYSDFDADLAYRLRLRKAPKGGGTSIRADASAGFRRRAYQAPFANRDVSGPTAGVEVGFDRGRSVLALGYDFTAASANAGTEILLLDEPEFKRDFNGNGRSTDLDARAAQLVDRSRNEHRGTVALSLNPAGGASFLVAFEHRTRAFSSSQPFDAAHRGRQDRRNEIRGEMGFRMGGGFRFLAGGRLAKQTTNRSGDPGSLGETDDFVRARAYAGLRKHF